MGTLKEHLEYMLNIMGKKIFKISSLKRNCLSKPMMRLLNWVDIGLFVRLSQKNILSRCGSMFCF